MRITRASVARDIAANIELKRNQHPSPIAKSGYYCQVCKEYLPVLTNGHARKHGYINKKAMLIAGAAKHYAWGKEIKHGFNE